MRQIIGRLLWIGNASDLQDPRALLALGIEAVVELADNEAFAKLPRDLVRFRFPLSDGGSNPEWLLHLSVNSVAALLRAQVPTLICCSFGLNRSVCVAAGGIALVEQQPFDKVLCSVATAGPADVSPGLLVQFHAVMDC